MFGVLPPHPFPPVLLFSWGEREHLSVKIAAVNVTEIDIGEKPLDSMQTKW
jgi:hypothetical protein